MLPTNLLWLPIDVPKFPRESLSFQSGTQWHFWSFYRMTLQDRGPYDTTQFNQHVLENFPDVVEWFKFLPYHTIRNIKFNLQLSPVAPHVDFTKPDVDPLLYKNNQESEPCGYRILVSGSRTNTMYVVSNGVKIYTTLPPDTDVYVLRHSDGMHGVEDDANRRTIFTHFEIDPMQHHKLIMRSLQKYSEYAIWAS